MRCLMSSIIPVASWRRSRRWGAREELASGLRSFPVRRYVVFYRPLVDAIEVVRVLHGARDVTEIAEEGGF